MCRIGHIPHYGLTRRIVQTIPKWGRLLVLLGRANQDPTVAHCQRTGGLQFDIIQPSYRAGTGVVVCHRDGLLVGSRTKRTALAIDCGKGIEIAAGHCARIDRETLVGHLALE